MRSVDRPSGLPARSADVCCTATRTRTAKTQTRYYNTLHVGLFHVARLAITRTGDGTTIVFHTRADFNNYSGNNNTCASGGDSCESCTRRAAAAAAGRAKTAPARGPAKSVRCWPDRTSDGNAFETSSLRADNG